MTSKQIGYYGEEYVCSFLIKNGYEIVKRNYQIKGGEIDIIAKKGEMLCFVEVKTRKQNSLISGEEAVTPSKRKLLIRAAKRFLIEYVEEINGRFDVAVVETDNDLIKKLRYYPNAFDASEI